MGEREAYPNRIIGKTPCVLQATGDLLKIPRNLYSVAFRQFEMISALHMHQSSVYGFWTFSEQTTSQGVRGRRANAPTVPSQGWWEVWRAENFGV